MLFWIDIILYLFVCAEPFFFFFFCRCFFFQFACCFYCFIFIIKIKFYCFVFFLLALFLQTLFFFACFKHKIHPHLLSFVSISALEIYFNYLIAYQECNIVTVYTFRHPTNLLPNIKISKNYLFEMTHLNPLGNQVMKQTFSRGHRDFVQKLIEFAFHSLLLRLKLFKFIHFWFCQDFSGALFHFCFCFLLLNSRFGCFFFFD